MGGAPDRRQPVIWNERCPECGETLSDEQRLTAEGAKRAHMASTHPPVPAYLPEHVQPGDLIEIPWGINREVERVVVHSVHRYDTGALSLRYRFASNPRGIDWSGFIDADERNLRLLSRGVCAVDANTRSLIPG